MPELRLVVLATQDRPAYAPRFADAMSQLLEGRGVPAATAATAAPAAPAKSPEAGRQPAVSANDMRSLIERANQALADYRRLTSEGKLGDAGAKLDELNRTLEEMNRSSPARR